MCGINGYLTTRNLGTDKTKSILKSMNDRIIHRGPDDEGVFFDNHVGLAMRRLSIIDIDCGHQPLFNEDGSLVIVFNGEIYNYKEVREDLLKRGHIFKTNSDTEVIIHAYEEFGEKCMEKLDGMFAFAIYNKNNKTLFIARDRIGEKPLYYFKRDDIFAFSSELKSLLSGFDFKWNINKFALNQYLSLNYIPSPLTIYQDIYKLSPGHYCICKLDEFKIYKYWEINDGLSSQAFTYNDYKLNLRQKLETSVKRRLRSDVPLGAFLSGGIDSSIIVGLMTEISGKSIDTFSIGFNEKSYDETDKAEIVSKKFVTNHHKFILDYNKIDNILDDILKKIDEPFADASMIPTYYVCQQARNFVKVVMTGDGGDEMFAGYNKYLIHFYSGKYNSLPGLITNFVEKAVYLFPDNTSLTRKVRKVIENSKFSPFEQRRNLMLMGLNENARYNLLKKEWYCSDSLDFIERIYTTTKHTDELWKTLFLDLKVVLEGDMLVKLDRMSALNSIEGRIPLLSHELVEFAYTIPSEFKIKGKNLKYILKDTFNDILPREILKQTKAGFTPPIDIWMRNKFDRKIRSLISENNWLNNEVLDPGAIHQMLNEHVSLRKNNGFSLWNIYILYNWFERNKLYIQT